MPSSQTVLLRSATLSCASVRPRKWAELPDVGKTYSLDESVSRLRSVPGEVDRALGRTRPSSSISKDSLRLQGRKSPVLRRVSTSSTRRRANERPASPVSRRTRATAQDRIGPVHPCLPAPLPGPLSGRRAATHRCDLLIDQRGVELRKILPEHCPNVSAICHPGLQTRWRCCRHRAGCRSSDEEMPSGAQVFAGAGHEDLQPQFFQIAHGGDDVGHVHLVEGLVQQHEAQTVLLARGRGDRPTPAPPPR